MERIVPGGLGLCRDDQGVIFVPGALVGEQIEVLRLQKRGGARHAIEYDVVEKSEERRAETDCRLHPVCGGCDFLHFSQTARKEALHQLSVDALRRIGRLSPEELELVKGPIGPSEPSLRRRVRLGFGPSGGPGFFARGSHKVIELERGTTCAAASPEIRRAIERLIDIRDQVRTTIGPRHLGAARLRLAADDRGHVSASPEGLDEPAVRAWAALLVEEGVASGAVVVDETGTVVHQVGDPELRGEVASQEEGGPFRSDAATFTQASRFGGEAITQAVLDGVRSFLAHNEPGSDHDVGYALELFAGAGQLTLPLARLGLDVVAAEGSERSVDYLLENLEQAGLVQTRVLSAHIDGGTFGSGFLDQLEAFPDILVADPPRTGISQFDRILDILAPGLLVLVSCDVATGARDLAIARRYGYRLTALTLIDAFERTSHVEWVAVLEGERQDGQDESP